MAAMAAGAPSMEVEQDLPGFRFHPTEEELLSFYLSRVVHGKHLHFDIIGTLNIYRHDPWDLPAMAKIGEREWYFFVPRDRKAGSGGRPNRTTERGFWKATGSDRAIRSSGDANRVIGLKKTLVFYQGRAPRGTKTDWVMNEYRLPDHAAAAGRAAPPPAKEDMVLCKIYRKATPLKEIEQRASAMEEMQRASAMEEMQRRSSAASLVQAAGDDYLSLSSDGAHDGNLFLQFPPASSSSAPSGDSYGALTAPAPREAKTEAADTTAVTVASTSMSSSLQVHAATMAAGGVQPAPAVRHADLPALQVPTNFGVADWTQVQDPFQLRSPWQDQFFLSPLAHLLC